MSNDVLPVSKPRIGISSIQSERRYDSGETLAK
jgi:hypothetical protein